MGKFRKTSIAALFLAGALAGGPAFAASTTQRSGSTLTYQGAALSQAVAQHDRQAVRRILGSGTLEQRDLDTALVQAVRERDRGIVVDLLTAGADAGAYGGALETIAADNGDKDIVALLRARNSGRLAPRP